MAKTCQGKKKVYVRSYSYVNSKGVKVVVGVHYRSTPN